MEFITVSKALDRLPIAHPKQITEDFKLKTQEVSFIFRGFVVVPVVDSNALKLCYTGHKDNTVYLSFNSSIIIDTNECKTKLFLGFGGLPIIRYYDANNNPLEHRHVWQGSIYVGDHVHGFENFPFTQSHIEIFTPQSSPKHFTPRNDTMVPTLPPPPPLPKPEDALPTYEQTQKDFIVKRVKV